MDTYAERILQIVFAATRPMDDDEIAQRMGIVRQNVNQICRRLEARGTRRRSERKDRQRTCLRAEPPPPNTAPGQAAPATQSRSAAVAGSAGVTRDPVRSTHRHPMGVSAAGARFGSGMTCWRRLEQWNRDGVWQRLHELLLAD